MKINDQNQSKEAVYVASLIERAKKAQKIINDYSQEQIDELVTAIAYKMTRDDVKAELAKFAVEDTELGDYDSKVLKIETKIKGVYRDIKHVKTVGVVEEDTEKGLLRLTKPVGVVGALTPSTQPEMIGINQAMFAIKARDAIVFSPHPRGHKTMEKVVKMLREILKMYNAPEDLLICAENVNLKVTDEIMKQCDLIVATGGAPMVKAAYSSGTPAYGVGAGNACIVVDDTADLKDAAHKTMLSKTADLAAGCSCDNSLIIFENIYDEMIGNLKAEGGYLCNAEEKAKIQKALFPNWPNDHVLNRDVVASPVQNIAKIAGIEVPQDTKFIMCEETGSGVEYPLSGEKMCVVLTVYKCKDIDDGIARVNANHAYSGAGHSCGIHSKNQERILKFAEKTRTTRVNVNLSNSASNTGNWDVGYPFSASLGCATWGGNIASENITLKFYMNNTWIARPIPGVKPTEEELFGDFDKSKFEK